MQPAALFCYAAAMPRDFPVGRRNAGSAANHLFNVETESRQQMVDITDEVQSIVKKSGASDGVAMVYVPHTTAGITIQENADPDVQTDVLAKLDQLMPKGEAMYKHGEGNSDAHLKTMFVGNSVNVLVDRGQLLLGRWQAIYLCEFDGGRKRTVAVKVLDVSPKELD